MKIQEKFASYCKSLRAEALLIAVQYAGSAGKLALMVGYDYNTGILWQQREQIGLEGARKLAKLPGFPLTFEEMTAGRVLYKSAYHCKHCDITLRTAHNVTGCSPLLKALPKRGHERRRIMAEIKRRVNAAQQADSDLI